MSRDTTAHGGRRGVLLVLALAATVAGVILLVVALSSQQGAPPEPPASAANGIGETPTPGTPSSQPEPAAEPSDGSTDGGGEDAGSAQGASGDADSNDVLPPSEPVRISIPAIDVRSEVFPIGKTPGGKLAVPQPGPNLDKAAWYRNSPTPGRPGPSIIEGHVATDERGPSIFFRLGDLRPGDEIRVTRADGRTIVYTIEGLKSFPKDEFPTELVYGGSLSEPSLRLITCSNFDPDVGSHTSNLIVFSSMTKVIPA